MTEQTRRSFLNFAVSLGDAIGHLKHAEKNDELALELAARGVSKKELDDAEEAILKIAGKAFYSSPEPA